MLDLVLIPLLFAFISGAALVLAVRWDCENDDD